MAPFDDRVPPLETPLDAALWVHILTGAAGLLLGAAALTARKGSPFHRRCGKYYVACQVPANLSAIPVAIYSLSSSFLAYLALYVLYCCFSGWRVLGRQKPQTPGTRIDWVAYAVLVGVAGGLWHSSRSGLATASVSGAFALIITLHAAWDAWELAAPPPIPRSWFTSHMGRMVASYIGSVTAVFVVQGPGWLPFEWRYLGPPLVFGPMMFGWMAVYFVRHRRAALGAHRASPIGVSARRTTS